MTFEEEMQAAEEALMKAEGAKHYPDNGIELDYWLEKAQIHATLALAAASALNATATQNLRI